LKPPGIGTTVQGGGKRRSVIATGYKEGAPTELIDLPWGTIGINVTGTFVLGCFGTLTLAGGRFPVSENHRLFVMIGLCGGYTTFSAYKTSIASGLVQRFEE